MSPIPRLTRRQWTALVAAAAPLAAQVATVPPQTIPAQKEDPISKVHKISQRLAEIELPMSVEPAFRFLA